MNEKTATPSTKTRMTMQERRRKYGFYASTFSSEELRYLDAEPTQRPEFALLRTKILRLAKLTPLKSIDEDQLDALIKLVRVAAALDAMERTSVMRAKAESGVDPELAVLAALDGEEI